MSDDEAALRATENTAGAQTAVLTDVPSLNPANIATVGFLISDQQAGPFRLEIGRITAAVMNDD